MSPNFKYESIPYQFNYCLNDQCKHAEKCLRYQASKLLPVKRIAFSIINPACFIRQAYTFPQ